MLKEKLKHVPQKPGTYLMKDEYSRVVYVGKAKNLKHRLSSYFTGSHDYKTTKMLISVHDFETIVTHSELEAFILEIDLIKKYKPRYNVLLTDDKSYPYIEITRERHPKLIVTRNVTKQKNRRLYGPFPNVRAARETLRLLNKLYPLRKCQRLPDQPCLYYHLGQCLAPCIKPVSENTYQEIVQKIDAFLKGQTGDIVADLKKKMHTASENLEFERAQEYKETIEAIHTTTGAKQAVNLKDMRSRDVVGVARDEEFVAFSFLFVRHGKISATDKKIFQVPLSAEESITDYLAQFYRTYPTPKEILVEDTLDTDILQEAIETSVKTPKRGVKKRLLNMAKVNAQETLKNEKTKAEETKKKTFGVLDELGELLQTPPPYHIEAFDNAHLFGSHPVSSLVVFKNGRPSKSDYRKFKLKDHGRNVGDAAQMQEAIYRRYRRVLLEKQPQPDLILVDGGIQQMNAASEVLKSLELNIPVAGLVKSEDHRTHHLLDTEHNTIALEKQSRLFHFLSHVQEEAHRFATTFHKDLREKGVFESILDEVPGIGEATKKKLLRRYRTLEKIKNAPDEELRAMRIPKKTVRALKEHLKTTENR